MLPPCFFGASLRDVYDDAQDGHKDPQARPETGSEEHQALRMASTTARTLPALLGCRGSEASPLSEKGHAFFSPWKKKGVKEASVTTMRWDDLGPSTPLESNKSVVKLSTSERHGCAPKLPGTATGAKMTPSIITLKIMSIIYLFLA